MKISEWLAQLSSHEIYDAEKIAKDFTKNTGLKPCWHVYSAKAIRGMIKARGLGGSFSGEKEAVAGYDIAESLAETLANSTAHRRFNGRGSRFDAALTALRTANL